jgi:hypothetical protein
MPRYLTQWVDYKLPEGEEFSVAVCGFSGRVRHLYIGNDSVRRSLVKYVFIEEGFCQNGDHCLALTCPLNRAEREHLLHMLDMQEDEILDPEAAGQWGTESALDGFLKFAQKISESLPEEYRKPQKPIDED